LGQSGEAKDLLRGFLGGQAEGSYTVFQTLLLEAAVLAGYREAVVELMPSLTGTAALLATNDGIIACIGRHLGAGAALLGDFERAKGYYQQGLEVCRKVRFRPEVALIRLAIAELQLDEAVSYQRSAVSGPPAPPGRRGRPRSQGAPGEAKLMADKLKAEGLAHLDFAIGEFREMKMQPALERALKHNGLLGA